MVQFSVINESTAISDAAVQAMIPAFQTQWNRDLAPAWDLADAQFTWTEKTQQPAATSWWVVFLDDSDQAGALAYHDLTSAGLPIAKVFVKTLLADKSSVSVGATHEICEMAVDPTINLAAQDPNGTFWAYEVCDPVEDDQYGYDIGGVLVTDFITPAWFGFKDATGDLDFQKHAAKAFTVLSGGYAQKFGKSGWEQVNGEAASTSKKTHVVHPSPGTRRLSRIKARRDWKLSSGTKERNALRGNLHRR
jgi:hypothetical protein